LITRLPFELITFVHCVQLYDEVDVILGDAWLRNEQAIIDFGAVEHVSRPTTVWLDRTQCTLTPATEYTSPPGACCRITARKALQLLVAPTFWVQASLFGGSERL
jgi:hypothetical protein